MRYLASTGLIIGAIDQVYGYSMRAPCGNSPSKTSGQVLLGGKGRADGDATLICPVARLAARSRYRDARRPVELCPRGCRLAGGRPGGRFLAPDRLRALFTEAQAGAAIHSHVTGATSEPNSKFGGACLYATSGKPNVDLSFSFAPAPLSSLSFIFQGKKTSESTVAPGTNRGQREFAEEIWRPRPPEPLG